MRSYGEQMKNLVRRKQPFSVADAKELGVPASALAYYCKIGKIQRLCQGVYSPPETESNPYPDMEQLLKKNSEFVVCLLSALQIHEFTTQLPTSLWIAIPQGARLPKLDAWPLTCIRLTEQPYHAGIEEHELYGMKVKVYSAAKTVADCFKFRNKIGLDVALEALREGYRLKRFTMPELIAAAKVCRVIKIMSPYMEGLLQ